MAVNLMVMPLSRYLSGDYITPLMEQAWEHGAKYQIYGPDGLRDYPPGVPMGGEGARDERVRLQAIVIGELEQELPAPLASKLWDERSEALPRFHRIDHGTFGDLLELAPGKKGVFGIGGAPAIPELHATLFLPQDFEGVLNLEYPIEIRAASSPRLLAKLSRAAVPAAAGAAHAVLSAALRDCIELGLPMVVDA